MPAWRRRRSSGRRGHGRPQREERVPTRPLGVPALGCHLPLAPHTRSSPLDTGPTCRAAQRRQQARAHSQFSGNREEAGGHLAGASTADPSPSKSSATPGDLMQPSGSDTDRPGLKVPKAGVLPEQAGGQLAQSPWHFPACALVLGPGRWVHMGQPRGIWPERPVGKGLRSKAASKVPSQTGTRRPRAGEAPAWVTQRAVKPQAGPWSTEALSLFICPGKARAPSHRLHCS